MYAVKTPADKPKKMDYYQIVQYPDKASPSGKVFFVDKRVRRYFLFIFPHHVWETVKFESGESIHWYDFEVCKKDVEKLKKGEKLYK